MANFGAPHLCAIVFKGGLRLNLLSAAPPSAPVAPSSVHLRVIAVRSCQLKANAPPKLRLGAGGFRRRRPWSTHGTPPCLREDRDHSHPRRPEPRVRRSTPHLASRQAGGCRKGPALRRATRPTLRPSDALPTERHDCPRPATDLPRRRQAEEFAPPSHLQQHPQTRAPEQKPRKSSSPACYRRPGPPPPPPGSRGSSPLCKPRHQAAARWARRPRDPNLGHEARVWDPGD